jgi:hypothetical protein
MQSTNRKTMVAAALLASALRPRAQSGANGGILRDGAEDQIGRDDPADAQKSAGAATAGGSAAAGLI